MYTVINCGGKNYKVTVGSKLLVNKLAHEVGSQFSSKEVLLHQPEAGELIIGTPFIDGASYTAKIERSFKDKKIIVFKKKRRKNYRRKRGHRQSLMEVSIVGIQV